MDREPNGALLRHLREAAWSDKGTARRVNDERLRRGRPTGYGGANVRGWLRGVVPDLLTREVLAFLLSGALSRRVDLGDLGFAGDIDPQAGLSWHHDLDRAIGDVAQLWRAGNSTAYPMSHHAYAGPTRDWLLAWPESTAAERTATERTATERTADAQAADVGSLWAACDTYQDMERRLGAGSLRGTVTALLTDVVTPMLRDRPGPAAADRQLLAVAARLTDILGYAAYEALDDGLAQRYFIQALRLARAADQDALAAHIFGDMARHAMHIGDLREALALARAGQRAGRDGGSPADQARNACLEARISALLEMGRDSAGAMVAAEHALSTVDHADAPSWVRYFTADQMHAEFAHVAAAAGRPAEVLAFAAGPLAAGDSLQRRTALLTTAVARAHLSTGALDHAAATAADALDLSRKISSKRVNHEVKRVCDAVASLLPASRLPTGLVPAESQRNRVLVG